MEFHIGDRVRHKTYEELPKEIATEAKGRMSGKLGVITDRLFSESVGDFLYKVEFDDFKESRKLFTQHHLVLYDDSKTHYFEFEYLNNVVVARLYEEQGESRKQIAIGHGHIIHKGAKGIAQAASYALKRIWNENFKEEQ